MAVQSVAEVIKKVRRIEIIASRVVNDLFAGEYHSVFRGRGMEFDEVREYQPGDEVRSIDWNVTARTGVPFVKRYREERELTVLFLVDVSASGAFGTETQSKLDLLIELAALLMFSALKNNDKVGLLLFCDEVLQYIPARKGKANVLRLIRELVAAQPVQAVTRIDRAVDFLNRVQKRRAVVFLLSDFLAPNMEKKLGVAKQRHELVAIRVADPKENILPDVGFLLLRDAESGQVLEVDTGDKKIRQLFQAETARRKSAFATVCKRIGMDELAVNTAEPYAISLHRFFQMRAKRAR